MEVMVSKHHNKVLSFLQFIVYATNNSCLNINLLTPSNFVLFWEKLTKFETTTVVEAINQSDSEYTGRKDIWKHFS